MELKTGYKNTEVGVIPEDWEVTELGEKFTIKNGLNKAKEYFGYGTPIVNYMDVFNNSGICKSDVEGKVFVSYQEKENYNIKLGDLLFTRTSETPDEIGMSSVILEKIPEAVFSGFVLRARPKDEAFNNEFKKYCFRSNEVRKQIISTCSYTTRALTNGKSLSVVKIPLPPLPEQTAIATVLSDTDQLLQALQKKIAKKRLIKKGAMQELLKPKEGWVVKTLGEVVKISSGESPSKFSFKSKGIPYFKVEQLNNSAKFQVETPYFIDIVNYIPKGSIIFPKRGASILLNKVRILKKDSYMDTNLMTLTLSEEVVSEYIYYVLIYLELWRIADTTSIPQINNKHILPIKISFPSYKKQTEIAQILSDMDKEIECSEKQLAKYKQVKQGLMQVLLTGKIRLL